MNRNLWRISWRHDYDDGMAIAGEVFARVLRTYTGRAHPRYGCVTEPRHWMALYKQALAREFHTYAVETRMYAEAQRQWGEEEIARTGDVVYNEGTLRAALIGASAELLEVITVIARAPSELLGVLLAEGVDDRAWSRRLCRLSRCHVNENIIAELRERLTARE